MGTLATGAIFAAPKSVVSGTKDESSFAQQFRFKTKLTFNHKGGKKNGQKVEYKVIDYQTVALKSEKGKAVLAEAKKAGYVHVATYANGKRVEGFIAVRNGDSDQTKADFEKLSFQAMKENATYVDFKNPGGNPSKIWLLIPKHDGEKRFFLANGYEKACPYDDNFSMRHGYVKKGQRDPLHAQHLEPKKQKARAYAKAEAEKAKKGVQRGSVVGWKPPVSKKPATRSPGSPEPVKPGKVKIGTARVVKPMTEADLEKSFAGRVSTIEFDLGNNKSVTLKDVPFVRPYHMEKGEINGQEGKSLPQGWVRLTYDQKTRDAHRNNSAVRNHYFVKWSDLDSSTRKKLRKAPGIEIHE